MEKAFVQYDATGRLVSGVLRVGHAPPSGDGWVEVPSSLCCSEAVEPGAVSPGTALQGFIKFTGKGRVIAGSTILRKKKPSDGKWLSVPYKRCC